MYEPVPNEEEPMDAVDELSEEELEEALVRQTVVGGLMYLRCDYKFTPLMRVAEKHRAAGWSYLGGISTFSHNHKSLADDVFTITMFKQPNIYPDLNSNPK
jgi:hypothetical protein